MFRTPPHGHCCNKSSFSLYHSSSSDMPASAYSLTQAGRSVHLSRKQRKRDSCHLQTHPAAPHPSGGEIGIFIFLLKHWFIYSLDYTTKSMGRREENLKRSGGVRSWSYTVTRRRSFVRKNRKRKTFAFVFFQSIPFIRAVTFQSLTSGTSMERMAR